VLEKCLEMSPAGVIGKKREGPYLALVSLGAASFLAAGSWNCAISFFPNVAYNGHQKNGIKFKAFNFNVGKIPSFSR
jgi:hypothetical protein